MIVYRVEKSYDWTLPGAGLGPYRRTNFNPTPRITPERRGQLDRCPAPWEDGIIPKPPLEFVCGFKSLNQYRRWFHRRERRRLLKKGFHLVVYEVPFKQVRRGRKQVMFDELAAVRRHVARGNENVIGRSFRRHNSATKS